MPLLIDMLSYLMGGKSQPLSLPLSLTHLTGLLLGQNGGRTRYVARSSLEEVWNKGGQAEENSLLKPWRAAASQC